MKVSLLTVGFVFALSVAAQAQVWDVLDETYGSGPGQISFVNSCVWPWSDVPAETLEDGYATLTHADGIDYAARENGTINLPETAWRMDVKVQLDDALGMSFYLGDDDYRDLLSLVQVNCLYQETSPSPNTISDYNLRIPDDGEIHPDGFDGSAPHVYSFRAYDGQIDMYLDDAFVVTLTNQTAGIDPGYEAVEIGFGANMSAGPGTSHVYYVKISSDPGVEPQTLPGDVNGDGSVTSADLDLVRGNWGEAGNPGELPGDANDDGFVNSADLDLVRGNWGASLPGAVPEPSTLLLLVGLGLAAFSRRR